MEIFPTWDDFWAYGWEGRWEKEIWFWAWDVEEDVPVIVLAPDPSPGMKGKVPLPPLSSILPAEYGLIFTSAIRAKARFASAN